MGEQGSKPLREEALVLTHFPPAFLLWKDALFSAVQNFSEAASDFHRRLAEVDLNK